MKKRNSKSRLPSTGKCEFGNDEQDLVIKAVIGGTEGQIALPFLQRENYS